MSAPNVILGTTGVINFNSFDVDGSGNVDIAGNFTQTGATTVRVLVLAQHL